MSRDMTVKLSPYERAVNRLNDLPLELDRVFSEALEDLRQQRDEAKWRCEAAEATIARIGAALEMEDSEALLPELVEKAAQNVMAEYLEQARLLGASADRETQLKAKLDAAASDLESCEEDFRRRQAAHKCATWDDAQKKCECDSLARTTAERQREACAATVDRIVELLRSGAGEATPGQRLEQAARMIRATPLVTERKP